MSLSGGKASDHRFGQSVSIAQIMRMVVEEKWKIHAKQPLRKNLALLASR
jgi:hypothetical protein